MSASVSITISWLHVSFCLWMKCVVPPFLLVPMPTSSTILVISGSLACVTGSCGRSHRHLIKPMHAVTIFMLLQNLRWMRHIGLPTRVCPPDICKNMQSIICSRNMVCKEAQHQQLRWLHHQREDQTDKDILLCLFFLFVARTR